MSTPGRRSAKQIDLDTAGVSVFEVFYEMKAGSREIDMHCNLSTILAGAGMSFLYLDSGELCLFKLAGGVVSDDEIESIETWFDDRVDVLSYEIIPRPDACNPLLGTSSDDTQPEQVLLLIPPSLH